MTTATQPRLVPIKPSKSYLRWRATGRAGFGEIAWAKALPFAANPRGVLTHRVRHVTTILIDGKPSHHHVHYLCGNGCNVDRSGTAAVIVADPPADRLLCDACEAHAGRKKLPSGDQLAGRHVHRGVLVPRQTCCDSEGAAP